ncbi:hypothetical protein BKI52_07965 [marine bacterium AO1-C]|nr:hypothetical protein BKI52_07965 [marine bacterium AO1-C]
MKILKRILLVVVLFIFIGGLGGFYYFKAKWAPPANTLVVTSGKSTIPCEWAGSKHIPREVLLFPIRFAGIDYTFYLQFDTGSPSSILYNKPLQSIQKKYPQFKINQILDDPKHLKEMAFSLDKITVKASKIKLYNYGKTIDWEKPQRQIIVGTLGNDFLERKKMLINFKTSTVQLFDKLSSDLRSKLQMIDFSFTDRRLYISGNIEGESYNLMYDSGTSAYSFITNHKTWDRLIIPKSKITTHKGNSWGRKLQVYTAPSKHRIAFGSLTLPLRTVTHIEGTHWTQNLLMRLSGMGGMIGNKIFQDQTIYIDAQNEQFALIK